MDEIIRTSTRVPHSNNTENNRDLSVSYLAIRSANQQCSWATRKTQILFHLNTPLVINPQGRTPTRTSIPAHPLKQRQFNIDSNGYLSPSSTWVTTKANHSERISRQWGDRETVRRIDRPGPTIHLPEQKDLKLYRRVDPGASPASRPKHLKTAKRGERD